MGARITVVVVELWRVVSVLNANCGDAYIADCGRVWCCDFMCMCQNVYLLGSFNWFAVALGA